MVTVRVSNIRAFIDGTVVRVSAIRAFVAPPPIDPGDPSLSTVRVTAIRARVIPSSVLTPYAGSDRIEYAFSTVTLDASGSLGNPTNYVWTQTSGPAVTLVGSGAIRTFVAPAPPPLTSVVRTFRLDVSDLTTTASDSVTITVPPHQNWELTVSGWVAMPEYEER